MSYYLKYKGVEYKLDATSSISVTYPAKTTPHPTQSRKVAADNYIIENPTASVSGYITDIKTPTSLNKLSSGDYLDELLKIRGQRVGVLFKYRLDREAEDNWFITAFTFEQDTRNGFGGIDQQGNIVQAFRVSISLERVTQAKGIRTDVVVPQAFIDDISEKSTSSKSTQSYDDEGEEQSDRERAKAQMQEHRRIARETRTQISETN